MNAVIIEKTLNLNLYGISGVATNGNYIDTGFKLMNEMWKQVKSNGLKNKGVNVWVYEENNKMFAGVELESTPGNGVPLATKNVALTKYAYYKHIGPYNKIRQACSKVLDDLESQGIKTDFPYLEIYGHWNADETKLETELIWALR